MPKKTPALKIIPLGGLDGIGKNMCAFEYGNDLILLDAGLMFPEENQPGIDLIIPDYSYVLENEHKLRAIIITHGHEDHIGALPYLLLDLNRSVPIYSSKLSLGMIEGKLAEHPIKAQKLREVRDGTTIELGGFSVSFFSMTHSIPAAFGVFIKTEQGTVLHTGDFKLDQTPIDKKLPNYHAINRFGNQGIDLLLSDSTNATRPGFTPSESQVGSALRHIIKNARGRVFVASFSSHIHRLQQVCDAAKATGRKIVVTGRSMLTNIKVARELGYLDLEEDRLIDAYDLESLPDHEIVVLCTGSQGEPLSALSRMANGEHKSLSIHAHDTVIISATPVPGNEKSVQALINSLTKIGCDIYDKSRAFVHVSGHASIEELKLMLAMTRPRFFMPVHGEAQHLRAHANLAEEMGIRPQNIFIMDNGDCLEMRDHRVRRGRGIESGIFYVEAGTVSEANPTVFKDRQKLSQDGLVMASVVLSKKRHSVMSHEVSVRGVSSAAYELMNTEAESVLNSHNEKTLGQKDFSLESYRRTLRMALSNHLWSKTHTRPMIVVSVMEV